MLASAGFDEGADETGLIVIDADAGLDNNDVRTAVEAVFSRIEADVEGVAVVQSPYAPGGENNIAASGNVGFAVVDLGVGSSAEITERAADVVAAARSVDVGDDVVIEFGGEPFFEEAEFSSEGIGLIAAVIILLFAFGSVLAMGLPIGTALFGIGVAVGGVTLLTRVMDVPDFAIPVTAMVGIGVGIDYALFIVTRYRQSLHDGNDTEHAVGEAIETAGRSVLFAGSTVVVSLLGLLLVNLAAIRTAAVAAALGVLFVMAASLTLLPALLGFVGTHIDRFRLPGRTISASAIDRDSIWFRWSRTLQKRPIAAATAGLVMLLVLARLLSLRGQRVR